jgi:hypothetical protein
MIRALMTSLYGDVYLRATLSRYWRSAVDREMTNGLVLGIEHPSRPEGSYGNPVLNAS